MLCQVAPRLEGDLVDHMPDQFGSGGKQPRRETAEVLHIVKTPSHFLKPCALFGKPHPAQQLRQDQYADIAGRVRPDGAVGSGARQRMREKIANAQAAAGPPRSKAARSAKISLCQRV